MTATPPLLVAFVKAPPAYRSLPVIARANTRLSIPIPSADQPLPFHLAMWLTVMGTLSLLAAVVKKPPAYTLLPKTVTTSTVPLIPAPSADQLPPLPFSDVV